MAARSPHRDTSPSQRMRTEGLPRDGKGRGTHNDERPGAVQGRVPGCANHLHRQRRTEPGQPAPLYRLHDRCRLPRNLHPHQFLRAVRTDRRRAGNGDAGGARPCRRSCSGDRHHLAFQHPVCTDRSRRAGGGGGHGHALLSRGHGPRAGAQSCRFLPCGSWCDRHPLDGPGRTGKRHGTVRGTARAHGPGHPQSQLFQVPQAAARRSRARGMEKRRSPCSPISMPGRPER